MRKFRAIIQSHKEPEDKEVFWLFKGRLLYYNNGQWVAVPLISQSAIDAANRANAAADKAELAVDDANTALESVNDALEKVTEFQTLINNANRPEGILILDNNGLVPSNQLPSYVDDVLEFASKDNFPITGETGKIYLAIDTNLPYRWSGSTYVEIAGGLALGETSTTAFAGDRGKKLEEDVNEQQETLDSVMGIMNKQYYAVSISSNPNVSVIEKGVAQLLQISWNSTFDGQPTTSTFVVKQGNEIINVPSGASSFNTEINDTTTFSVAGTRNGVTKTASKTINAYYPKYYGGLNTSYISTPATILTFDKQAISSNPYGTYTITSKDNEYIWFCIPSDMTINKVTLGGFNVPLATPTVVSVPNKGNYKCYRTSNPLSAGTRQFVIS